MKALLITLFISFSLLAPAQDSACLKYRYVIDSLQAKDARLKKELFLANYKIEKVRYYLNICLKNKSQDKFLKGWVRRALE